MDILNKAGSYLEPAGLRPTSVPKIESAALVAQTENSVNSTQEPPTSGSAADTEIVSVVSSLNESVQNIQRGIEFSVDEESGHSVIKVVDRETGDVIRQLPTEEALAVSRHIQEFVEARQAGADSSGQSDEALGFIMQVQA